MAAKRTRTPMSDEHKAALAEGRNQGRVGAPLSRGARGPQAEARPKAHARNRCRSGSTKIDVELATRRPAASGCSSIQERIDLQSAS